jgi:hypothetical protein
VQKILGAAADGEPVKAGRKFRHVLSDEGNIFTVPIKLLPCPEKVGNALPRVSIRLARGWEDLPATPHKWNFDTNHALAILADVAMTKKHCNIGAS